MTTTTSPGTRPPRATPAPRRTGLVVVLAVAVAVVSRLPYLHEGLSSDEAGFLIVGGQWGPGSSLYGDYWVDRPPALVAIFALVDLAGGTVALRLLGAAAAAVSVVLAAAIAARLGAGRTTSPSVPALAAVLAAALVSNPLLDSRVVNGEILALPFVLAGTLALLCAVTTRTGHPPTPTRTGVLAFVGGAAGLTAIGIKQNLAEVALVTVVLGVLLCVRREVRRAAVLMLGCAAGAVVMLVALLLLSVARGTDLLALFQAVVTFRLEAGSVIAESATGATTTRGLQLTLWFVLSGAPVVLALAWWLPRRRARGGTSRGLVDAADLTWLSLVVVVFELCSIGFGGSYWQHYLVQVVPGLVLIVGCAAWSAADLPTERSEGVRRGLRRAVAVVVVSAVAAYVVAAVRPSPSRDDRGTVAAYLRDHAAGRPRTAVVAFGYSMMLRESGMTSHYPDLWSLPVRVRDPDLTRLTALLDGPQAPTWLVTANSDVDTWGVDGAAADAVRERRYTEVLSTMTWTVYELED